MEVVIPVRSTMDFDFSSARSTPYSTAPSTPKRFGELCFSAPTSPTRASEFYRDFHDELAMIDERNSKTRSGFVSAIPFDWEETPGTPKSPRSKAKKEDEFAFDFSEELEKASLSAEELFDGGKIKPLKPPPGQKLNDEYARRKSHLAPKSPKSPISQGKKIIQNALSPRQKKHIDPFSAAALQNTSKKTEQERGRERLQTSSNSSRRSTRSLSPYRVSQYPWEEEQQQQQNTGQLATNSKALTTSSSALNSSSSKSRKWSLKDFLLFRSASEGRASDRDPLKKYSTLFRKHEDVKNSSFRSTDSFNSGSNSKRRGPVSAHELHYTMNRAASEDLKKKTYLPYKQGILGRFSFQPISSGFGTLTRG